MIVDPVDYGMYLLMMYVTLFILLSWLCIGVVGCSVVYWVVQKAKPHLRRWLRRWTG